MDIHIDKYPLVSFSWEIQSGKVCVKTLDLSSFKHHGTGIPSDICEFWSYSKQPNVHKDIKLITGATVFDCYITCSQDGRARMFWANGFSEWLRNELPEWAGIVDNIDEYSSDERPKLRFERLAEDGLAYSVSVIDVKEIENDITSEDIEDGKISDGRVRPNYGSRYERNPKNRAKAIAIHGYNCAVCGFNFQRTYGPIGRGFVEIHHTKPLHTADGEISINPNTDLVPLCSNCHRMIHRKKNDVYSVEVLAAFLLYRK